MDKKEGPIGLLVFRGWKLNFNLNFLYQNNSLGVPEQYCKRIGVNRLDVAKIWVISAYLACDFDQCAKHWHITRPASH
jgi:hypothetical protein